MIKYQMMPRIAAKGGKMLRKVLRIAPAAARSPIHLVE
jgi:hypothetical protein